MSETEAILAKLIERFPQVLLPPSFVVFLREQAANRHILRRARSEVTLLDFFQKEGVARAQLAHFFDDESRLRLKIDFYDLSRRSSEYIFTYLVDHLAPLFDMQQIALDSEWHTGFNSHGREHVMTVSKNASALLHDMNSVSSYNYYEKEAIIGGLLHDIGNLISRRDHGLYGIYLITQLFENFTNDPATLDSFFAVLESVLFHEVEFGSQNALLTSVNPATLCVIIADKTDVSFRRVSAKSNLPEAMEDAHVLINLLVADSQTERSESRGERFTWTIHFRPKFNQTQFDLFSSLIKATGRVKYPKEWTALYAESNMEYLFVFQSTFLNIYLSRLYLTIKAVFALYPSIQTFHLVIDDAERGISLRRLYTRDDYIVKIHTLGKLYYKERWGDTYLYRALELPE